MVDTAAAIEAVTAVLCYASQPKLPSSELNGMSSVTSAVSKQLKLLFLHYTKVPVYQNKFVSLREAVGLPGSHHLHIYLHTKASKHPCPNYRLEQAIPDTLTHAVSRTCLYEYHAIFCFVLSVLLKLELIKSVVMSTRCIQH